MKKNHIKKAVKKRYSQIAQGSSCCPACHSGEFEGLEQARRMGYSMKELEQVPGEVIMGLGCGNPTALADLMEGETVLDLGSGGGIDVFLASQKVGSTGHVIGVDMTEEMIEKAQINAQNHGYENVEFRFGEIENLPVDSNSVDVIISNCVINLSPDKLKVFQEAYRVLKHGGRLLISDLVTEGELPDEIKNNFEAWAGCIAGALEKKEYITTIKKAGFTHVDIVSQQTYNEPRLDDALLGKITSVKVRAYKMANR